MNFLVRYYTIYMHYIKYLLLYYVTFLPTHKTTGQVFYLPRVFIVIFDFTYNNSVVCFDNGGRLC